MLVVVRGLIESFATGYITSAKPLVTAVGLVRHVRDLLGTQMCCLKKGVKFQDVDVAKRRKGRGREREKRRKESDSDSDWAHKPFTNSER